MLSTAFTKWWKSLSGHGITLAAKQGLVVFNKLSCRRLKNNICHFYWKYAHIHEIPWVPRQTFDKDLCKFCHRFFFSIVKYRHYYWQVFPYFQVKNEKIFQKVLLLNSSWPLTFQIWECPLRNDIHSWIQYGSQAVAKVVRWGIFIQLWGITRYSLITKWSFLNNLKYKIYTDTPLLFI